MAQGTHSGTKHIKVHVQPSICAQCHQKSVIFLLLQKKKYIGSSDGPEAIANRGQILHKASMNLDFTLRVMGNN